VANKKKKNSSTEQINHYSKFLVNHNSGYFEKTTFVQECKKMKESEAIQFYDSNTGKLLFTAPVGRSMNDFLIESRAHGWPSFRGTSIIPLFCSHSYVPGYWS
jgi:hypothetical protein